MKIYFCKNIFTKMKLLVSGYRNFFDYEIISREMKNILEKDTDHTVIHGGCFGVDTIAGKVSEENNWNVQIFNADWSIGKKAGPIRNQKMIDEGKPDFALLFLSEKSKGTLDMKNRLDSAKIKYKIINI